MDRRRTQRVDASLTVHLGRGEGTTRNVSESGLYFVTEVPVQAGERLSLTVDHGDSPGGPLRLRCEALVLRVEPQAAGYGVAVSIDELTFHRDPPSDAIGA
jgi:hypothetical protein